MNVQRMVDNAGSKGWMRKEGNGPIRVKGPYRERYVHWLPDRGTADGKTDTV